MNILVLGGDGYVGWPLSLRLAITYPNDEIIIVDNQSRRKLVAEVGGESVTPIRPLSDRIDFLTREYQSAAITTHDFDIRNGSLETLIAEKRPQVIYHLAQQPSAHYSMKGVDEAIYTVCNNEEGNLRLLWAVRDHVPECHIIKLGSFGEYAKCGIDIAEGYFKPQYNGKEALVPTPYPRQSDDVYHISKINDSNYISMACRKWGLRVTDIMQATVFGLFSDSTDSAGVLQTRFDYDEYFGTVLNRFITQVASGLAMTIYGDGEQTTGLMALEDVIDSLVRLKEMPARAGEHKVVNHVVEKYHSINELADIVTEAAKKAGVAATTMRSNYDPRREGAPVTRDYEIESDFLNDQIVPRKIGEVIAQTFSIVSEFRERINPDIIKPSFNWHAS